MCQSVRLKRLEERAGLDEGHKYPPILLFSSGTSFIHMANQPTSLPTSSLTVLPGLPTAITCKNFSGPPHVVGFLKSCVPLLTWCGGY